MNIKELLDSLKEYFSARGNPYLFGVTDEDIRVAASGFTNDQKLIELAVEFLGEGA